MIRRTNDFIKITNLHIFAHHGVLAEEKENGQNFFLNAKIYVPMRKAGMTDNLEDAVNYDEICTVMHQVFSENVFDLIETAAEQVVQAVFGAFPTIQAIELEVRKPHAPITHMPEDVSVTIYREWHKVYVSFGGNHEPDPRKTIEDGLDRLKATKGIRNVVRSGLIQTKPYGPVPQPDFINGCLQLETYMEPEELMTVFRGIEDGLKRDRSIKWGPRPIDLDILFFDDYIYHSDLVSIPHVDMENRMFVLEPLSELCPLYRHPVFGKTVVQMRQAVMDKGGMEDIVKKVE